MLEITRRDRIEKILTFSIDDIVLSKLENRFGMITGRIMQGMSFSRWMATVPFVSHLFIYDSTKTSRVKPGLICFSIRKSVRNV